MARATVYNNITTPELLKQVNDENIKFNQNNTIDLIDHINKFNYTRKSVMIDVTDAWDTVRSTKFSIYSQIIN